MGDPSPALLGRFYPFCCCHRLDPPPPEGRGGAGALAVWADAGFSFGGLGPLKYITPDDMDRDITRAETVAVPKLRIYCSIPAGVRWIDLVPPHMVAIVQ